MHPINVRVGGFYRAPAPAELATLVGAARAGTRDRAGHGAAGWPAFDFPDFEPGLRAASRSPSPASTRSTAAASCSQRAASTSRRPSTSEHVIEQQVRVVHALHVAPRRRPLLPHRAAGALRARATSGCRRWPARPLPRLASAPGCRNPFRSIIVRAVELVYAVDEALRLIEAYEQPDAPAVEVAPRAGVGYGVTEAPRGLLYHRYEIDADGHDPRRRHRPPDLAEPGGDRGRPARRRRALARPRRRRAHPALRAGDPQLRPVHLLRDALPGSAPWRDHGHRNGTAEPAPANAIGPPGSGTSASPGEPVMRLIFAPSAVPEDCEEE